MKPAYHHGDLRRALLDEATAVLESDGVGALALRDLARRTGVSATAPYHHFRSKADLVCALAEDALGRLDAALGAAGAAGSTPAARLRAQGVAYVLFAVDHPARFRVAFQPETGGPFDGLAGPGGALPEDVTAFRHLARAVRDLEPAVPDPLGLAVAMWSLVHGLASLLLDGPLRGIAADRVRVRVLAEQTVAAVALPGDARA